MSFTVFGALRQLDESRHRADLYRALHTGVAAGLAPAVVLEQMGTIPFPVVDEARRYLVLGLAKGTPLGALVKARPNLFAPLEGALLAAGDDSGTLDRSLRLLTDFYTIEFKRRIKVRSILGYPVFAGLVASFGLPFVLLPKSPVKTYAVAIVGMLAAFLLLGGVFFSILASMMLDAAALSRARFARVLASALESGVPAGRAVRLAVDASGNRGLAAHLGTRTERELSTTPLAALFEGCEDVPAGLLGQMRVADATGDYAGTIMAYALEVERQQQK